jgi:hypothetical protein
MRTVVLTRGPSTPEGTFGIFQLDDGWKCFSGELPWFSNAPGHSSIPPLAYPVEWALSPKHGWCYHIRNVPGRSLCEIHSANWMGDELEGKKCQLEGCIALGLEVGELEGQKALLSSKDAIAKFHEHMNREPFQLVIHNAPPEEAVAERKVA